MARRVEVRGAQEFQAKIRQVIADLHGKELVRAFEQAAAIVVSAAKRLAPVDTGRLRSSISNIIENAKFGRILAAIGSNLLYSPYMELGTGIFAGRARYFPPIEALERWARRHGMNAYSVARAIWLRGGLRPREYLQRGLLTSQDAVIAVINRAVKDMVEK